MLKMAAAYEKMLGKLVYNFPGRKMGRKGGPVERWAEIKIEGVSLSPHNYLNSLVFLVVLLQ